MTLIGVPMETKNSEKRVALTPSGVQALRGLGHDIIIEKDAGEGSNFSDQMYSEAGAWIGSREEVWRSPQLIVKVKEPLDHEIPRLQRGQVLFTYLHLAADSNLTARLLDRQATCIAYETVQSGDGSLPLLTPMSEIAGRLAAQTGATLLEKRHGGKGILLGGVTGVLPAHVVVIGAGVAGVNACQIAKGMAARVTVLDINRNKLQYVGDVFGVETLMSNTYNIASILEKADLVISTVLIPGAKAPKLVTREMISRMQKGSVIVDVSIDQGGSTEASKPTTHDNPTFMVDGIVVYCVANIPGAVPMSSTYALTNATLPYVQELACMLNSGFDCSRLSWSLRKGVNVYGASLTNKEVATAHNMLDRYIEL